MGPQLYITMYKEQFRSPGKVKRTELRPTSAQRRNNPHPRPDFLYPRSLHSNYRPSRGQSHLFPPLGSGRSLFPPVRHFSPHNPVKTYTASKALQVPAVNGSAALLHSAGRMQKIHLPAPPGTGTQFTNLKNPVKTLDNQRSLGPLSALHHIQKPGGNQQFRPQTTNFPAAERQVHWPQYRKCCSNNTLDYSGCHSCFQVVKPYQAGHYIIHPEFISESLY